MKKLLLVAAISCALLPASAKVIEGLFEHSQNLPPIGIQKPGTTFDESKMPVTDSKNRWYKIPQWLAGSWQSKQQSLRYQYDYRTRREFSGKNWLTYYQANEEFGKQMDKQGNVWDMPVVPLVKTAVDKETTSYHDILDVQYIEVSEDSVALRVRSLVTLVSRATGAVVDSYQQESISVRLPESNGLLRVIDSIKVFDAQGQPIRKSRVEAVAHRTKPFQPIDTKAGQDLRKLFAEFLQAQGQASLIP